MTSFEQDLPRLLSAELPAIDTPVGHLVHGALARGRVLRRRRNLRRGGEAAFALAIVATLALTGVTLLRGNSRSPSAAGPAIPAGVHWPATPPEVATVLTNLIAADGLVSGVRPATSPSGAVSATAVLDDGRGAASVGVSITPPRPAGSPAGPPADFAANWACTAANHCTIRRLTDGSLLMTATRPPGTGRSGMWFARHGRLDGSTVYVEEWNAATAKTGAPTRAEPPLTARQLDALVTSPAW